MLSLPALLFDWGFRLKPGSEMILAHAEQEHIPAACGHHETVWRCEGMLSCELSRVQVV